MRNKEWKRQAACVDHVDLFVERTHFAATEIPPKSSERDLGKAKKICFSCPVRSQCLEEAMTDEAYLGAKERHGIRGGLTARERILIAAQDLYCARCPTPVPVAKWHRVSHIKRLCRSCQQYVLQNPAEKYFVD